MALSRYQLLKEMQLITNITIWAITGKKFHESLIKAKDILERNQYPPIFYEPIISATIEKIVKSCNAKVNNDDANNENSTAKDW